MNNSNERDAIIEHLSDGYIHLYNNFNELLAEFTTLLITINGGSYFETDTEDKVKLASEAAMIFKKKNKTKQLNVIINGLQEYHDQL